jgi:hypothetical protein
MRRQLDMVNERVTEGPDKQTHDGKTEQLKVQENFEQAEPS